jgi:hypothetical protein
MEDKEKREFLALQKKRQVLSSWNWFYQNSDSNLAVSRYLKVNRTIIDRETGKSKPIKVYPYVTDMWNNHYGNSIDYSKSFTEDREKSSKCINEMHLNQVELDKYYKK